MADAIRNNFLLQIAFFARRAARIPAVFDFLSIFFNLWSFFKVKYNWLYFKDLNQYFRINPPALRDLFCIFNIYQS